MSPQRRYENHSSASPPPPPPSFFLRSTSAATSAGKSLDAAFHHRLRLRSLKAAHLLHSHLTTSPSHTHTAFLNRRIDLLCRSGRLGDARKVFDEMPHRDTCSFNTLINGYSVAGELGEARRLFELIPVRDHVSWSSIIACYARRERPSESLRLYRRMLMENLNCNRFAASSALAAATALSSLRHGREIHCHAVRARMVLDSVLRRALSDMYAECGRIEDARRVFDPGSTRDVVSWTAMMERYFDSGRAMEGLELFYRMLRVGVRPNDFAFAAVLDSCSDLASEGLGRQVHGHMLRVGFHPSSFAATAILHMYAKCGSIEKANMFFRGIPKPDLVAWTSMLFGFAQNGLPAEALRHYELLLESGTMPDHITFVAVLSACAHAGMVDRGLEIFNSIKAKFDLQHTADHYACLVDLLSRAGRFQEAKDIIHGMPMKPCKFLWASLLGGCRIHRNLVMANWAAESLLEIEPDNPATYVTLANIYASVGLWNDVAAIRRRMNARGVAKKPGSSWIEFKSRIHFFLSGDVSHPQAKSIYALLAKLQVKMKEEGYVADTSFVLHDVEEEQKERALSYHSEKLAVAFGIMVTPPGAPVKVFKNLRICGDCHNAFMFISKIAEREIIVRDSNRFHRFRNGVCSCGDYW